MNRIAVLLGVGTALVLAGLVAWLAVRPPTATGPALMRAVTRYDVRRTGAILARDPALAKYADECGDTPLHLACGQALPEIVDLLLRHGADKGAKNARGETPVDAARAELGRAKKDGYSQQAIRAVLAMLGEDVRDPGESGEAVR